MRLQSLSLVPNPGNRAAAAFHYGTNPRTDVAYISDAYRLLSPAVGTVAAKVLFGIALLASGQNSTITGTLAGVRDLALILLCRSSLPWSPRCPTRHAPRLRCSC